MAKMKNNQKQKNMKKLLFFIVAVIMVACGEKDPLLGMWESTEENDVSKGLIEAKSAIVTQIEFQENGNFSQIQVFQSKILGKELNGKAITDGTWKYDEETKSVKIHVDSVGGEFEGTKKMDRFYQKTDSTYTLPILNLTDSTLELMQHGERKKYKKRK